MIVLLMTLILSVLYGTFVLTLYLGIRKPSPPVPSATRCPMVSVIVPARNESKNILACLDALENQSYPQERYEVIVVDDHSRDDTVFKVNQRRERFRALTCLSAPQETEATSPKKAALAKGIRYATGTLILTTDADCRVPPTWIECLAAEFKENTAAVLSWVLVTPGQKLSSRIEYLDSLSFSIVGAAAAGLGLPILANGANWGYRKDIFYAVKGFGDTAQFASGDDDLLLQKIRKTFKGPIRFLHSPECVVTTHPCSSYREFMQQRRRWASKRSLYPPAYQAFLTIAGLFILFFLLAPLISWLAGSAIPMAFIGIKITLDWVLFARIQKELHAPVFYTSFVLAEWFQPLYLMVLVVTGSKPFTWKDRRYRHGIRNANEPKKEV